MLLVGVDHVPNDPTEEVQMMTKYTQNSRHGSNVSTVIILHQLGRAYNK